ncbi:MAG: HlyD family efflux transporter periplasmic adaptor subunit [Bacteroidales bacterium]|nr:HlyD family efflux transporter periplasmic adaptor subunit [Bacteroidales bacterium]
METKNQHKEILFGVAAFATVVVIVALIGWIILGGKDRAIQGEVEVEEYRVSFKLPGRILQICVHEGDYVRKGDTLAYLDAPDVEAKKAQAQSLEAAAAALVEKANNGAQEEQIRGAYELWQQAIAAVDIYQKSFDRVNRLYEAGVVSEQKKDEAEAQLKVHKAKCEAAKSQYDMAMNGARYEDKKAAAAKRNQAAGAVAEVNSYIKEMVQVAQFDGEVVTIYPKVGELVGAGSPVMTIAMKNEAWGVFNIREDQLKGMNTGDILNVYSPALDKNFDMKVTAIKDQGSYAVWKATKENGAYDLKTFEVKTRPTQAIEGLRSGMSLIYTPAEN